MSTIFSPLTCRVVVVAIMYMLAGCVAPASAQSSGDTANARTGVVEGVLVAKGEGWIAVRADGAQAAAKLLPRWIGGTPQKGGGPDKRMLLLFRELEIGVRLKVAWLQEKNLHVVDLQVLPPQPAKDGEKTGAATSGVATGVVTAKGETWISVRADGEQEPQKLFPKWIGGTAEAGGGFDRQILQLIAQTPVGARVRVDWVLQEQLRVTSLKPVE